MSDTPSFTLPPYAEMLGIRVEKPASDGSAPVLALDYTDDIAGRPGLLHGGAIAGLLDMAANAALQTSLDHQGSDRRAKPIGITIDFIRGARSQSTYARGKVTRIGRRVATVIVEAWQEEGGPQVAAARLHMLLSTEDAQPEPQLDG